MLKMLMLACKQTTQRKGVAFKLPIRLSDGHVALDTTSPQTEDHTSVLVSHQVNHQFSNWF